ncbi:MAG TPA: asparagine synthase (glutamine-hydrolyzing) [Chitinophagales bacterium]|nr:asparagine synthase (glutamine-hydrolyzing) [Chitinophagales bacterium]
MCGIAGFISHRFSQEHLQCLTQAIKHRGPDAEGFYYDNNSGIGLGHRRLSIIDLSEAANQPFYSHDGRYVMVYNGEVYNYKEVAAKYGIQQRTTSDSEVIIEAFALKGTNSFSDLNGMFAFAIWDKHLKKLTLARDHIGIKPLYISVSEQELLFASEIKAITAIKKDLTINKKVVPSFLHLGYIPHPFSIYNEVIKLDAGSFIEISVSDAGTLSYHSQSFWQVSDKIAKTTLSDEQSAKNILDSLLTRSIAGQLVSDVPVGTFLSGGTDSSLVTALACKVSDKKVNSFSIAVTDGKINEAPYAAAVAKHLKTDHYELPITQKEILEMVPDFMSVYDEPFTDSSAFPTMLVSKLARQHVTVTLSGDGGDELFGGYGRYLWVEKLQSPLYKTFSPVVYAATRFLGSGYKRAGNMFEKYPAGNFKSHLFSQTESFFSENELKNLLVESDFNFSSLNSSFNGRKLNAFEEAAFWDIENYLKDDLLVKVDRASMRYSLETRVPLLDYKVVEFALNLSPELKINKNGTAKYLLKQILYDYVPKELLERPKWGFSIPLVKWLKTDLKWMIDKYCSKEMIEQAGIVRYDKVKQLIDLYLGNKNDYLYNRIWSLIVLHWFFYDRR